MSCDTFSTLVKDVNSYTMTSKNTLRPEVYNIAKVLGIPPSQSHEL